MNISEIQILFPRPGKWEEFTLTAVYEDAGGYTRTVRYTADDIPTDHAPAMAAVVAALVGLAESWQASQVWARRGQFYAPEEDDPLRTEEAVELTVEVVHAETRGRRIFTASDYPVFVLTDPAAVAFFKHFTTQYEHE